MLEGSLKGIFLANHLTSTDNWTKTKSQKRQQQQKNKKMQHNQSNPSQHQKTLKGNQGWNRGHSLGSHLLPYHTQRIATIMAIIFVMTFSSNNLLRGPYQLVKNLDDMYNNFDTMPAVDDQYKRQKSHIKYQASVATVR